MRAALARLAIAAASLLAALVAAELVLRAATPSGFPAATFENVDFLRTDPVLGWRTRANLDVESVRIAGRPHAAPLRTDSRGFRSPEPARERPPGGVRIVCLGDSGTFGYWLEGSLRRPETATVHFEGYVDALRRLEARPGVSIEVVNAGVLGYSSSHGLRQLERCILPLRPDVVTVRFGYNDHTRSAHPGRRAREPRGRVARSLLGAALDLRVARLALEAHRRLPFLHPAPLSVPWVEPERFAANLRRFAELAREHRFRLLFLDYPLAPPGATVAEDLEVFVRLAGAHDAATLYAHHAAYQEILARVAREEGIPLLASAAHWREAPVPLFEPTDPVHPNRAGALALGRLLHEELEARGWLEPAGAFR
jgi:lysophospholipase L1-like esterase